MTESDGVRAIRSAGRAVGSGDVDGYLSSFDRAGLRRVASVEHLFTLAEVEESLRQLVAAFEGLRLHEESIFGEDDSVCARWRLQGTHTGGYLGFPATGRSIDVETCEVYRFGGGLVVDTWTYGDPGALFRQIAEEPR